MLEELELAAADFSGEELTRCTLRRARLRESRWDGVPLEECVFEDCA
ncbi:MAG TPA: hypothetical protein VEB43_11970 [Anaeromyxobacter sp.]|nr:hypothetical protein [Anaeromyxobacter sp.]